MGKIIFDDKSYVEISKSDNDNKFIITIVAKDGLDHLSTIASSVELTLEQFNKLISLE